MSDTATQAEHPSAVKKSGHVDGSSLLALIKISSLLAFLTTYSHFFGFSFLKGKLEAMGFYAVDVNPSVNETLFLASEGLQQGINSLWLDYLHNDLLIVASFFTGAAVFAAAFYALNENETKAWFKNLFGPKSKGKASKQARIFVLSIATLVGFLWQAALALIIFLVLSLLWLGTSLGHKLGENHIALLVEQGVCQPVQWSQTKAEFAVSCMTIMENGNKVYGLPIYQNEQRMYFLSASAAYATDPQGKIVFHKLDLIKRPHE